MARLLAGVVVFAMACGLWSAVASAETTEPAGPRIAFEEVRFREPIARSHFRIATVGPGGEQLRTVFAGGSAGLRPLGTLSWSPDGSELAFAGIKGSLTSLPKKTAIYVVAAAGGTPRIVAGTGGGSSPVWSPDGGRIAFARDRSRVHIQPKVSIYLSTTTWIVSAGGGHARRLTPWGNGKSAEPSSFSPDGRSLAVTREQGDRGPEAVLIDLSSDGISVIDREAEHPSFSPDGSRIALASYRDDLAVGRGKGRTPVNDLYTVAPDGSDPQRLTHTPNQRETAPSWDPSGSRIAFVQSAPLSSGRLSSVIAEVNADGTCPTLVTGNPKAKGGLTPLPGGLTFGSLLVAPVWRPGPDRGTVPIAC